MSAFPTSLEDVLGWLAYRAAEQDRRARSRTRMGKVVEVNAPEGWARVQLTEGGDYPPLLTGKIPWKEQAMGAMRTHFPPSVGQQVRVVSENGDLTDAEIDMSIPQESTPRPSQSGEEYVLADVGGTRIVVTGEKLLIETGDVQINASTWVANIPSVDWNT